MTNYLLFNRSRLTRLRGILCVVAGLSSCIRMEARMDVYEYFKGDQAVSAASAAESGHVAVLEKLLNEGLDVNTRGVDGMTLLMWAILNGNKESFEYLLLHGADPNLQLSEGTSEMAKELPFAGNSAMSFAAMHKDIWFLDTILKRGGNVNLVNPYNTRTPIYGSIAALRTLQTEELIRAGANLNYQDNAGVTPLLFAARCNRFDLVYQMLVIGADPMIKVLPVS